MNFHQMNVSTRLACGFGSILTLLIAIVVLGLVRISDINEALDTLLHNRTPKVERLNDMAYRAMDNARVTRNIVLLTDEKAKAANKAAFDKNVAAHY